MPTEAGKGEHKPYLLSSQTADPRDDAPITPRRHYLAVDAVLWFVNKQGNFLHDRMASGTVHLNVAGEDYEVGLGIYELQGDARTAPVFNRPLLPNRVFRGGQLTIKVFVGAIEQDSLLGGLLRDMARASLDVVAGAVGLATASGPEAVLLGAGKSLIGGLQRILKEGKRPVTVFDPGGVDITLAGPQLRGPETYLLVHRGGVLNSKHLSLRTGPQDTLEVLYDGRPLDDGAWVLFRLRREDRFGGPRPWEDAARQCRSDMDALIDRLILGGMTVERVSEQLMPKNADPPTVADRVMSVAARIRADHVLTEGEATLRAGELTSLLEVAQIAIRQQQPEVYREERAQLHNSLATGASPGPLVKRGFDREAKRIAAFRMGTLAEKAPELSGEPLWQTLRHVTRSEPVGVPLKLEPEKPAVQLPGLDPDIRLPADPPPAAVPKLPDKPGRPQTSVPSAGRGPFPGSRFPRGGSSRKGGSFPGEGGRPGGAGSGGGGGFPGGGSGGGGGFPGGGSGGGGGFGGSS